MIKMMINSLHLIPLIYLSFTIFLSQSAPPNAIISQLPGFNGTFPSKHYAGYVTVDEKLGKRLYYYYVLSERNPAKDPVVLWLNGGPGCSSFDGFVYEHGPFNFKISKDGSSLPSLLLNPHAWSKVSNIIYLDSPAGVGLSFFRNKSAGYITSDSTTASDSHKFLLEWFKLYPEYLSNPFFIAGESYAGVYIPMLSYKVVKGLDAGDQPTLNFKGYMIGNGVTDEVFDGNALVPFAHGMALISDEMYEDVVEACQGNYYNNTNVQCQIKLEKIDSVLNGLNIYNILDSCDDDDDSSRKIRLATSNLPMSFRRLGETQRPLPVRTRMFGRAWPFKASVKAGYLPSWPELLNNSANSACIGDEVADKWLNNEAVRRAIHADPISVAGKWTLCTSIRYRKDVGSMIKYHKNLIARGYRVLIYSGDHDMCVPFTGSEAWTRSLGYKIVDEWRSWHVDRHVAGFIQGYDKNLTFLTIKGSGHTVPEYKPKEALAFYSRWLEGKKI